MTEDTLKLTYDDDGYDYLIKEIQSVELPQEKPSTNTSLSGQKAEEAILMGVQGMTKSLRIRFMVYDDGTDKANGTAPAGVFTDDTVETLNEQREWLLDYIHDESFSGSWSLSQINDSRISDLNGFLGNIRMTPLGLENYVWFPCTIEFTVGSPI